MLRCSCLITFCALIFCQLPCKAQEDSALHYLRKGELSFESSDYVAAESAFHRALVVARANTVRAEALNNLANVFSYTDRIESALDHYQQALRLIESESGMQLMKAKVLKNIAGLYEERKDFPNAFAYLDQATKTGLDLGDTIFMADCMNNRGLLLEQTDSLPQAYHSYHKALELYKTQSDSERLALVYNNLGVVCKNLGYFDEAIGHYEQSLHFAQLIENDFFIAANYNNLGNLYTRLGRTTDAVIASVAALEIAKRIGQPDLEVECLRSLADHYTAAGDFQNALIYRDRHFALHDSLLDVERLNALAEMETRFDVEGKALIHEQENERKKLYIMMLAVACFIIVAGAIVFFRIRTLQQKRQELELITLTEKNERDRIARDLHDELGSGITRINWITASAELETAAGADRDKYRRIGELSHQLSANMKSLIWLLYRGDCSWEELTGRVREMASQQAEDVRVDLAFAANASPMVLKQNAARDIFLVVKEAINNACKYASAQTIKVNMQLSGSELLIEVIDDGAGYDPANTKSGNGLSNMVKRMGNWKGIVRFDASPGKGVRVQVRMDPAQVSSSNQE